MGVGSLSADTKIMDDRNNKFSKLIDSSSWILVITHVGPDPDAFCSLLLMGTTLALNYPDKQVMMSSEELTGGLSFLPNYKEVKLQPLQVAVDRAKPDLIIMVDAMNLGRCTRGDAAKLVASLKTAGTKLAIIDHHEQVGVETNDFYLNQGSPAAVQDVYELLFDQLKLKKPVGYAEITLLGLYADTGGFIYENPRHKDTFKLVDGLLDAGASLERIKNQVDRGSPDSLRALGEFCRNLVYGREYSYSFISDEFTEEWQEAGKSFDDIKLAVGHFANDYVRNVGESYWGFVVYRDLPATPGTYGVSLRAESGSRDVAAIAKHLGGGGHKPAAGVKIKADNVQAVVRIVKDAIEQVK